MLTVAWRTVRLAAAVNARSKLKFVLLTVLVTISTTVFLAVSELARASTADLTAAIESDLGVAGTYSVQPSPELGLTVDEQLRAVQGAVAPFTERALQVAVHFPSIQPECPPFEQFGAVSAVVLLDEAGGPAPFRNGGVRFTDADLCLAGLVVPNTALREATPFEDRNFGANLVVDPLYEQQLRLSQPEPPQYVFVVTTGLAQDQTLELSSALHEAFADAAAQASIRTENSVVVLREDSGDLVRSASDGIQLVYGLIGWGVLLIGGIGLLVAELIVLRDRTWFFGLARAVGARRWNVAWLILADILIIMASGLGLTLALLLLTSGWVTRFGETAFQVDLAILRPAALPGLALGLTFVLLLGGAYPAWRATRLDPLDVLERG